MGCIKVKSKKMEWFRYDFVYSEVDWEKGTRAVPYPELFQTPKRSKVLISGVSFRQRSLLQSQESDVLSYSECKIAKNFQGFAPGPHWGGLTAPPQTPRLHNGFSPRYAR